MTLHFLAPSFLWLLVLLPLLWILPRRVTDVRHGALRTGLLAALLVGLARPVLLDSNEAAHHVVILDRSASLTEFAAARAEEALQATLDAIPRSSTRSLVVLGGVHGEAEAAATGSAEPELPSNPAGEQAGQQPVELGLQRRLQRRFESTVHLDGVQATSISAALELALSQIPAGSPGAVTLISDGMATDRRWGPAMLAFAERGIPLHTVPLASDEEDPRVVGLRFDKTLRVGHSAHAIARLAGRAQGAALSLRRGDETLARVEGLSFAGESQVMLRFEPTEAGFYDLQLVLEIAEDARPETNLLTQRIAVQNPLRVLYLGQRMQGGKERLAELLGAGFALQEPKPGEGTAALEGVDLVVLDDRPAKELSPQWRERLQQAVRDEGVGLFASGGRAAFGSGGYANTEIEEMLPIEFVQKEEKKDPSTTLAIIIDSSGSMVGSRMTLAKQVARLAMRRLQPHDKVGIVEFYGTKSWAAPIQSAANQIDLQRALNRLDAQGGTVLMPAVEEAYYAMKNVQTRYKHVLILTDAGVETGDYESLLRRMADEGMTVSTVLVGPGRHSDFLVDLADWGGGRYYNATDRFNLPELLLKKPSTSVLPAYRPERVELEASGGPGWWGDVDPRSVPPLEGFVESELAPGAQELLSTRKQSSPVLASRLYGLGRVTAFMSEPTGDGTRGWAEWDGYGSMLGRVLARTARGQQPPFDYALERRADEIRLEARRLVTQKLVPFVAELRGDAAAELAAGSQRGSELHDEVAPGLFRRTWTWPVDRPFELKVSATLPGSGQLHSTTLLVSSAGADVAPERQVDPAAAFPLARASLATGGLLLSLDTGLPELPAARGDAPLRLLLIWPWFVLASLLLFVLDVFHRRRANPRTENA
jgi:Ca-activated chloride channel family protein